MRKESFNNNNIYHIFNRGVDKRNIFLDNKDYCHFLDSVRIYRHKDLRFKSLEKKDLAKLSLVKLDNIAKPLVEILAYVLVKNHFHFILRQLVEKGITEFMHKLGTLFTMYFNEKYERTGSLFEGPFKAISVLEDNYLFYLSFYIHLHPAEFVDAKWKEGKIKNWKEIIRAIEEYKWSSYPVYLGKREDELVSKEFILSCFKKPNSDGVKEYKKFIEEGLNEGNKRFKKIEEILLDNKFQA